MMIEKPVIVVLEEGKGELEKGGNWKKRAKKGRE